MSTPVTRTVPFALLAAALALAVTPALAEDGRRGVHWSEVREAIAESLCVSTLEYEGEEYMTTVIGERITCGYPSAATPAERAVERAFEKAERLISAFEPPDGASVHQGDPPVDERTLRFRDVYLNSRKFLGILMPKVESELGRKGYTCDGCPEVEPPPRRTVSIDELMPYVTAHVWPDPVRDELDENGEPTGEKDYSYHICSGINGLEQIEGADPRLTEAGFLSAMYTDKIPDFASEHFQEILGESSFRILADDEMKTRYLRRSLPRKLAGDPRFVKAVCRTLRGFSEDLMLDVDGCSRRGRKSAAERARDAKSWTMDPW